MVAWTDAAVRGEWTSKHLGVRHVGAPDQAMFSG